jgi:hypothetical protein
VTLAAAAARGIGFTTGTLPALLPLRLTALPRLANGRAGGKLMVGLESAHIFPGDVALNNLLYTVELLDFVGADQ